MESAVDQKDKQCKYKFKAMEHRHLSPPQYRYSHRVLSYHAGEIRVNRIEQRRERKGSFIETGGLPVIISRNNNQHLDYVEHFTLHLLWIPLFPWDYNLSLDALTFHIYGY